MLGRGREAGLDPLHRDEVIPDHVRNCRLIAVPEQFGQNVIEGPQLRDEVVNLLHRDGGARIWRGCIGHWCPPRW